MSFYGYRGGLGLRSTMQARSIGGLYRLKSAGVSVRKGASGGGASMNWSSIRDMVDEIIRTDQTDINGSVSDKADSGLTAEYKSALEEQAKKDAGAGVYGKDGKANELRDAQMKKYVSPDRDAATAQANKLLVSSALGSAGTSRVKLTGLPYTASITKSASGISAALYDERGEKFASYDGKTGKWTSIETKAESQFKTASSTIYGEAYRAAQAGKSGGAGSGLDTLA